MIFRGGGGGGGGGVQTLYTHIIELKGIFLAPFNYFETHCT